MIKRPTPRQQKLVKNYLKFVSGKEMGKGTKKELLIKSGYSKYSALHPEDLLKRNPAFLEAERDLNLIKKDAVNSFAEIMVKAISDIKDRDFSQEPLIPVVHVLKLVSDFLEKEAINQESSEPFCLPSEVVEKYKLDKKEVNKS